MEAGDHLWAVGRPGRSSREQTGGLTKQAHVLSFNSSEFHIKFSNISEFIFIYKDTLNYLPLRKNDVSEKSCLLSIPALCCLIPVLLGFEQHRLNPVVQPH
jgi:hypothetical protein